MTEIRKVLVNKNNGAKFVCIPKDSDILPGEYVSVKKIDV